MPDQPAIATQPAEQMPEGDKFLVQQYEREIVTQVERLDDIAKQLLALGLAIPGLFATLLKLVAGDDGALPVNGFLYGAFFFWFVALFAVLNALLPRQYLVNPRTIRRSAASADCNKTPLSIEEFYLCSARYKWRATGLAATAFLIGVALAAASVIAG